MYKLCFVSLMTLLLFSCAKQPALELRISAEQQAAVIDFIQEFDKLSTKESTFIKGDRLEYYEKISLGPNEFSADGSSVISEDVSDYLANIGHSVRSLHEWAVDHGSVVLGILSDNPEWITFNLIEELIDAQYAQLKTTDNEVEQFMYKTLIRTALEFSYLDPSGVGLENIYVIRDRQLMSRDGVFNTFVRMQIVQELCHSSNELVE